MTATLAGMRAFVGGGSRGLGRAIVDELAQQGASVAVVARPSDDLEAAAAAVGGHAIGVDLSQPDGPETAVARASELLGGLDLLVINSGGPAGGTFAELSDETWMKAIEGTMMSTIRLLRAALPGLREGNSPAVLVILSSSVREPIAGLTTSNALRPGLAGLIKSVVPEIAPIRINGIAPGRVMTERIALLDGQRAERAGITIDEVRSQTINRIPLGRYGDPAEVGAVAAFLLSPAAAYVTGAIVPVDGGMIRSLP